MTSRKLTNHGIDTDAYERFVAKTTRAYVKQGKTPDDARRCAEGICIMYQHTFRRYA